MSSSMEPIEIFRAGSHTAMNGEAVTITEDTLHKCASAYDPARHEAPLVIGHPKIDAPAYGWVKSLGVDGDKLLATVNNVDPEFAEVVRAGRFKKISAAFWQEDASENPSKGVLSLKHVGFLGAAVPAVKGMKQVRFAGADGGVLTFSDPHLVDMQAAIEAVQAKYDNEKIVDNLIAEGRFLPVHRNPMLAFMERQDNSSVVSFAGCQPGQEKSPLAFLREFLKAQPKIVHFGGINLAEPPKARHNVVVPDGHAIGRDDDGLLDKISTLMASETLSFSEALTRLRS